MLLDLGHVLRILSSVRQQRPAKRSRTAAPAAAPTASLCFSGGRSGLTNKEIAGRLYLPHRTVGAHLHRVYLKLGVTTRVNLRDALAAPAGEQ